MQHDLSARITKIFAGSLMCLVIGTRAFAGDQPVAAVPPGQEEIVLALNAKAQAVDAALNDMRSGLKVAADLQATLEKETGRKGQAEASAKAGQDALKTVKQNIVDLKSRLAAAEKELTALDKQKKSIAKLQETLAQFSRRRVEAEAEAQHVQAARAAAEQDMAGWKAKLEEAVKKAQAAGEPGKAALQLEGALKQEQDQRDAVLKQVVEARKALEKAEKSKAEMQAKVVAAEKRLADGAKQQEQAGQLQTELTTIRQARAGSQAQADEMAKARAMAEQTISELKNKLAIAEKNVTVLEKEGKVGAQLQEELTKERKLTAEAEAGLQQASVAKTAAEQEMAALKARLAEVSQKAVTAQEQAKQCQSLQDEIGKAKQSQESLQQDAAKARVAVQAAEKERNKLQAQVDAQAKRVAEGVNQQKAVDQIQEELAKAKQACAASKANIGEASQARVAAVQTIAVLKQKLAEGEKQAQVLDKQGKFLARLQAELADVRKMSAEWDREVQRAIASRAEAEQAVTDLTARLTSVQTSVSALAEQAGVIKQLQAELKDGKQASAAAVKQLEKEKTVLDAAGKEKAVLQARITELEKQVAEGAAQQKALEQLRDNLAQAKQARTEAEAKLKSTAESQAAAQKETADLKRKVKDMDNQLDDQVKQAKVLKDIQAELGEAQKIRKESEAEAETKTQALAAMANEQNALKSRLADMQQQYAAKQDQVKAVAQAQADLKRERELREQTAQRMAKMADQEKASATQIRDLEDQLRTVEKKNTALAKDLERQSQIAATPVVEGKARGEPESVAATEKIIIAQAKGEPETGATGSAQGADKAKAPDVFVSAGSKANQHYMLGIQKWDAGDIDGAIAEFKEAISLDSSLAGAYYNIALGYGKKGERDEACDYAYQAGKIYLKNKNNQQATRMVVLIKNIDPSSSLIEKLRKEIAKKQP